MTETKITLTRDMALSFSLLNDKTDEKTLTQEFTCVKVFLRQSFK